MIEPQEIYYSYTGNGATLSFTYGCRIFDASDLVVTVAGITQSLGVHYNISGIDEVNGGEVTFIIAPTGLVELERILDCKRGTGYAQNGDFRPETVDRDQDYQTALLQQMELHRRYFMRLPVGSAANIELPDATPKGLLAWNAAGTAIENLLTAPPYVSTTVSASAYGSDLSESVDAIGSADVSLVVDSPITVNSVIDLPANISLEVKKPGVLIGNGIVIGKQYPMPEDYAAKGDGTTDDTIAFQKLIDSGASPIYLKAGRVYITGPLDIDNKTIILKSVDGAKYTELSQPIFTGLPELKLKAGSIGHHFTASGPLSSLRLEGIQLNGNRANQIYESHGVCCASAGDVYSQSTVLIGSNIMEYKGDGIHLERNRNLCSINSLSRILSNSGNGVYGREITDLMIYNSHVGYSGLNNVYLIGGITRAVENIRFDHSDFYEPGKSGDLAQGSNIVFDNFVRGAHLLGNDYQGALTYQIYIAANSINHCMIDIIGGRFGYSSRAATNVYSDVFAGHAGVTLTGTGHMFVGGSSNKPKYLVEVGNAVVAGAESVGVSNILYTTESYGTAVTNSPLKTHWIGKSRNYFAQDQFIRFNQSSAINPLLDSYGSGGGAIFQILANGKLLYGDGTNPGDVSLSRKAPGVFGITLPPNYSNNAAAVAAGLPMGAIYRNGDLLQVVH